MCAILFKGAIHLKVKHIFILLHVVLLIYVDCF